MKVQLQLPEGERKAASRLDNCKDTGATRAETEGGEQRKEKLEEKDGPLTSVPWAMGKTPETPGVNWHIGNPQGHHCQGWLSQLCQENVS
ncbi:hypothetical protein E5288_WYG005902 [Bos mutus]|uniref:Uncharacterized protein n=1 Tax=Bos mutus TaxID=72004 RepID=A0A6B0QXQ9_9CETA|nr:hypothetical protein [Bos mutus]